MKLIKESLFEQKQENKSCDKLKNKIIEYYKSHENIDFSKSIELEWDDKNKLCKVWVDSYSDRELYKGKTGLSESNAKENYIILSKKLRKEHDPHGWIPHEIGHILGYRKGFDKRKGNIFKSKEVGGLNTYPNVWSEFYPFYMQMKYLSKHVDKSRVIKLVMADYISSDAHKDDKESIKQFKRFFTKFYKEYIR